METKSISPLIDPSINANGYLYDLQNTKTLSSNLVGGNDMNLKGFEQQVCQRNITESCVKSFGSYVESLLRPFVQIINRLLEMITSLLQVGQTPNSQQSSTSTTPQASELTPSDNSTNVTPDTLDNSASTVDNSANHIDSSQNSAQQTPATKESIKLGKSGEFLWKPVADKDGKLVILLPQGLTGEVASVRILNSDGTKILAKGRYSGVGNGNRMHYRFTKAGSAFPDGSIVEIKTTDGKSYNVAIKETSKRFVR